MHDIVAINNLRNLQHYLPPSGSRLTETSDLSEMMKCQKVKLSTHVKKEKEKPVKVHHTDKTLKRDRGGNSTVYPF